MELQKVIILRPAYFHVFKKLDGSIFEVEATEADYLQLVGPDNIDPSHPDGKWLGAYRFYKFNTASGKLEHGQYSEGEGKDCLICWNGLVDVFESKDLAIISEMVKEGKFTISDPAISPQCKVVKWL